MAEIWPSVAGEGLDIVLGVFPKGGSNIATTYVGLFTAFTATTVGTEGQAQSAYTEVSGGSYARQAVASNSWGAQAAGNGSTGRKTTAGQLTFPTATAAWGTINGFFLSD